MRSQALLSYAITSLIVAAYATSVQAQIPLLPPGQTEPLRNEPAAVPAYAPPARSASPILSTAATSPPSQSYATGNSAATNPVMRHCVVKLIDQVLVSVQEPGLITALEVREGLTVEADSIIGRVNDSQSRMAKLVAEAEAKIADQKAANEVEIRYSESAAKVAEFEYRAALRANQIAANSISSVKVQELALAYEKVQRQIESSQHNQQIYREEAAAKRVAVNAAEDDIRRRQIMSPISGEVVEVPVHLGEWVKPGDVVCKIVRLDQLAVEGFLRAADYEPGELINRPVLVETTLARGRRAQFVGKITFVHPEVDARGQFRIKAEVANAAENGQFLLRPGHEVDMLIQFDASTVPAPSADAIPLATPPNHNFPR